MGDALITLHGDAHQKRRLMEMTVFNRGFFRNYEHVVFPATLQPLLEPVVAAGELDLVTFGYRVTMNLTADFAGIDRLEDNAEETDALLTLVKKFSEGATMVHSTRDPQTLRTEIDRAMDTFQRRFLQPSRARRLALVEAFERGEIGEHALPRDVLTTLLRNRHTHPLTDDIFRREITFYLQAGAHSTANSVVHALHEIFRWRSAHAELWSRHADDAVFIQRCVHESLRLNPASPVAWRRAARALHIANRDLQPGQQVVVDLQAANRDVTVFGDDAANFNPLRSTDANAWGLSFGYGVHACLGRTLDGGVLFTDGTDPDNHQYGIVTLLVSALLAHGVQPHPTQQPIDDATTTRQNWSSYPVMFSRSQP
jgi:cytochrome P450